MYESYTAPYYRIKEKERVPSVDPPLDDETAETYAFHVNHPSSIQPRSVLRPNPLEKGEFGDDPLMTPSERHDDRFGTNAAHEEIDFDARRSRRREDAFPSTETAVIDDKSRYIYRFLKSKILELTTPLTNFVNLYLALSGVPAGDDRPAFELTRLKEIHAKTGLTSDWKGLMNALYGTEDDGYGYGVEFQELIDAVKYLVELESDRSSDHNVKQAANALLTHKSRVYATANALVSNYENFTKGNVTLMLDPVLRAEAQSCLNAINEAYAGRTPGGPIRLLEVMRSDIVLTKFIELMLRMRQARANSGVIPISPNRFSGKRTTMGDRLSKDGGSGRVTSGSGYGTLVLSQPTAMNINVTSIEFHAAFNAFRNVVRDGRGGLKIDRNRRGRNAVDREREVFRSAPDRFAHSSEASVRYARASDLLWGSKEDSYGDYGVLVPIGSVKR